MAHNKIFFNPHAVQVTTSFYDRRLTISTLRYPTKPQPYGKQVIITIILHLGCQNIWLLMFNQIES